MGKYYSGRGEETEGHILQALRISPRDACASAWMAFAAFAKFGEGKDEEAAAWARRSIDASPDFMTSHFVTAAAFVGLGRMAEARRSRPYRARPHPDLQHRPLPGLPVQRQSKLPRRTRAHPRRPAQGRRA
jgi:hypothetical protein